MGFWIFMLIMDLLTPAIMIGFGRGFMKHPPKTINMVYGYRTSMSMKNKETWDFAHTGKGHRYGRNSRRNSLHLAVGTADWLYLSDRMCAAETF